MNPTLNNPIQPRVVPNKSSEENERMRKTLFAPRVAKKGKPNGVVDEAFEKARRQAQDEYMDRLEKQFIQR